MTPPPPATPVRPGPADQRRRKVAGIVVAVIAHLPTSGLLLPTMFTFTFYAQPDTPAFAACLAGTLYVVFFLIGYLVRRGGDRQFGRGLLIGWTAGFVALVLGGALIAQAAVVLS